MSLSGQVLLFYFFFQLFSICSCLFQICHTNTRADIPNVKRVRSRRNVTMNCSQNFPNSGFAGFTSLPQPPQASMPSVTVNEVLEELDGGTEIEIPTGQSEDIQPVVVSFYFNDPAHWQLHNTDYVNELIKHGAASSQNRADEYPKSKRTYKVNDSNPRFLQNSMLVYKHANGESHPRLWLCYSPTSGMIYCF
jgi:hypothetical protein